MNGFWKDTNAEGLALAKEERWPDALRAFEDALVQLDAEETNGGVTQLAHDDARAQLLLNIGQSYFHTGAMLDARRFAERSCAIRVSLYGEDALVVARTRGDLAVILGASGQLDEAMSLLERAVSAVERKRGDESAHLVPLLTNAARLLERTAPELARPYVARLNALLFARRLAENAATIEPTAVPSHSFGADPFATASDDHYLRSAIAETVDLLRTTPSANVAVNAAVSHSNANTRFVVDNKTDNYADDNVDEHIDDNIDDTIFDLVEAPPTTLNAMPEISTAPVNPLGFEVQYGIPQQLHEPLARLTPTPASEPSQPRATRSGIRAVGGVRRGSTQVVATKRLWYIGVALAAFGAGIGLTYLIMPLLR